MKDVACPYCYWQTQCKGWLDADSPILREVPMCFGVKEPDGESSFLAIIVEPS